MIRRQSSLFALLIESALVVAFVSAQNVATTSNGAVAVGINGSGRLVTRRFGAGDNDGNTSFMDPPDGLSAFSDVSIDRDNESLVFALSVLPPRLCSYTLSNVDGATPSPPLLTLVNCVGSTFAVNPFCGISAMGGTLVVSGGTGGVSVFAYDKQTGLLQEAPKVENDESVQVIGNPDVVMLTPTRAVLSSDIGGSPRFGSIVVDINDGATTTTLTAVREFRIPNSSGFDNALGPSNFPLVNAVYDAGADNENAPSSTNTYSMYTANGGMQVQDPNQDDGVVEIPAPDASFQAVTVAVNQEQATVVFGGLLDGSQSVIYSFDIIDLFTVVLRGTMPVNGRITSLASGGESVSYVTQGGASIEQFFMTAMLMPSSAQPTTAVAPPSAESPTSEPPTTISETSSASTLLQEGAIVLFLTLLAGGAAGTQF